ncbi:MAG: transposase [Nitrospirae bacterium]|nr:transposase [Nitrospirota bacterium]
MISRLNPENVIVIDETGTNLTMVREHGWSMVGERAYGKKPFYEGENVTLIGAIGLKNS